ANESPYHVCHRKARHGSKRRQPPPSRQRKFRREAARRSNRRSFERDQRATRLTITALSAGGFAIAGRFRARVGVAAAFFRRKTLSPCPGEIFQLLLAHRPCHLPRCSLQLGAGTLTTLRSQRSPSRHLLFLVLCRHTSVSQRDARMVFACLNLSPERKAIN